MTQSFDNVTTSTTSPFTHVTSGSNRVLLVGIESSSATPPSLTYAGTSLTLVTSQQHTGYSTYLHVFYLVNPAVGSNSIAVTGTWSAAMSVSYREVLQATAVDSFNSADVAFSGVYVATLSVTTVLDKCLIVGFVTGVEPSVTSYWSASAPDVSRSVVSYLSVGDKNIDVPVGGGAITGSLPTGGGYFLPHSVAMIAIGLAPVVPTVVTQTVSAITGTSATGNGNMTDTGGGFATERGIVWSSGTQGNPGNVAPASSGYSGLSNETGTFSTGTFNGAITGLSTITTYYVRAYAKNTGGYAYGAEVSFATIAGVPVVTTQGVTGIVGSIATGNGTVISDNGSSILSRGTVWSTTSNPTTADSLSSVTGTTGVYVSSITGIAAGAVYHDRAFATNTIGTGYGVDVRFGIPGTATKFLTNSVIMYGQYDQETPRGVFRLLRKNAGGSETDVAQMPVCLIVSNLFYGSNAAGYTGNQVGSAKLYFSSLETSGSTTKYKFYKFLTVPTGSGVAISGVYETQQETSFKLFRDILKKKLTVKEVRLYTVPLVAGNSFLVDLIGNDGNPIPNGSYTFTVGTNLTAGTDFAMFNPHISPQHSIGLRITNLGDVNWVCEKAELDCEESGK